MQQRAAHAQVERARSEEQSLFREDPGRHRDRPTRVVTAIIFGLAHGPSHAQTSARSRAPTPLGRTTSHPAAASRSHAPGAAPCTALRTCDQTVTDTSSQRWLTIRVHLSHISAALKVHFIAIAGTGMGALARLLVEAGHEVRGSDTAIYPPMSEQLARAEIPVMIGFAAENLDWAPDAIVVGNVCSKDHPEVVAALARGLPLESFPSLLARLLLASRDPLVVAGTHGKTTTTSLLAWFLREAGLDPSYLVGGVPLNFGIGAHLGKGRAFVIEGDEYDTAFFDKRSKFLHYRPKRAILTSVEFDHADIFAGLDEVRAAFAAFVATIPEAGELVVNADDSEAMGIAATARCKVTTYRVLPEQAEGPGGADLCALQ
ncbi:MAG: hypothetical protein IAG13_27320, partial [Deltaproteobacteria bacterium]|nr:hypothetical protein [Nannocystaceae bacterium]